MPNIKSQKKRVITNEKARLRNKPIKSALKTAVKQVRTGVQKGAKPDEIKANLNSASRLLDKAASKGVIHKNQAANRKSGLAKLVSAKLADNNAASTADAPAKPATDTSAKPATKSTTPAKSAVSAKDAAKVADSAAKADKDAKATKPADSAKTVK